MLFRLIDARWKVTAWTVVIAVGHGAWLWIEREPGIVQRCGSALVVLGIVVGARGFLREGVKAAVGRQMPRPLGVFPVSHETLMRSKERSEAMRPEIERDVRAERIWAFCLIIIGTTLNGYAIFRRAPWEWRMSPQLGSL